MITTNLSTLKINKLTKAQYERELAAGRIDENALYLTHDDGEGSGLPEVTQADNGKVLMVVNGRWQVVSINLSVNEDGALSINNAG